VCSGTRPPRLTALATSSVRAGMKRRRSEATRWWRVHPTVGVHAGEGLKTTPRACFLSSCWVARRPMSSVARSLRHRRGSRENEWALGFGRGSRRCFCSAGFRMWPLDEDGRLTTGGPTGAAQVGKCFPGPGPPRGLVRGACYARAGRRAIFCFGPVSSYEQ
jgi:hypothetical protein